MEELVFCPADHTGGFHAVYVGQRFCIPCGYPVRQLYGHNAECLLFLHGYLHLPADHHWKPAPHCTGHVVLADVLHGEHCRCVRASGHLGLHPGGRLPGIPAGRDPCDQQNPEVSASGGIGFGGHLYRVCGCQDCRAVDLFQHRAGLYDPGRHRLYSGAAAEILGERHRLSGLYPHQCGSRWGCRRVCFGALRLESGSGGTLVCPASAVSLPGYAKSVRGVRPAGRVCRSRNPRRLLRVHRLDF